MSHPANSVLICCYHAVTREPPPLPDFCFMDASVFREQVAYLMGNYRVVGLSEAVARLAAGEVDSPLAVVTFDDGYYSSYDVAFPILQKERCPATFFLATGLIDSQSTLWFCRVVEAVATTPVPEVERDGMRFDLSGREQRIRSSRELQTWLKRFPAPRLAHQLRRLVEDLGGDPDLPVGEGSPYRILTRAAVEEMARYELVEFVAHTRSHAILSRLSPEDRRREIEGSLADVERLVGRPAELFAYPNGEREDYDRETLADLARLAIRAAVTAQPGLNDESTPLLELRRASIGPEPGLERFRAQIGG